MDIHFKKKLSKSKLMPIDNGHRYTEHKSLFVCFFVCLFVCLLVCLFFVVQVVEPIGLNNKKKCGLCCKLKFSNPYIFVTFDYLI